MEHKGPDTPHALWSMGQFGKFGFPPAGARSLLAHDRQDVSPGSLRPEGAN